MLSPNIALNQLAHTPTTDKHVCIFIFHSHIFIIFYIFFSITYFAENIRSFNFAKTGSIYVAQDIPVDSIEPIMLHIFGINEQIPIQFSIHVATQSILSPVSLFIYKHGHIINRKGYA